MIQAHRYVVAVLFASLVVARSADAQGLVSEKGSLQATLAHNFGFADTIVETDGLVLPNNYVNVQNTVLSVEYVPIKRLAISAALPLIGTKYDAEKSGADYLPHGPYDDGSYHFTLQDLALDARYMVLDVPYALAFNLGLTIPTRDYPVQGTAAPGRGLFGVRLGVGMSIYPEALERAFLDVGYELQLFEKFDENPDTAKYGQTRSEARLSAGYFILDKLAAFLVSGFRLQHDGIDFKNFDSLTMNEQDWHDPILKEMGLLLGAGAMYQLNDKLFVTASYSHFILGRNTMTMNWLGVSVGWNIL